MRYVMENIEADELPGEMRRREIPPRQRLRVIVETLDNEPTLAQLADNEVLVILAVLAIAWNLLQTLAKRLRTAQDEPPT